MGINYKNAKYVAIIALILSLLAIWLLPFDSDAAGKPPETTESQSTESKPERIFDEDEFDSKFMLLASTSDHAVANMLSEHRTEVTTKAAEVEAPSEITITMVEVPAPEPVADEEVAESQTEPETVTESMYHNRYAGIAQSITASDKDILVRLVYHESRGKGGEAVVETVFNRMLDKDFPDTLYDVVYQRNQFEPASGLYSWPINEPDSYAKCEEVVAKVLSADYEPILPSYYLYFNNFEPGSSDYIWLGGNVFYGFPS